MLENFEEAASQGPDEFERALAATEQAAGRRQKQFWALSIVWVAAVLFAAFYIRAQIASFQQNLRMVESDQQSLKAAVAEVSGKLGEITGLREERAAQMGALTRKESGENKDPFTNALQLAQAEVAFEPLTRSEQQALATQRRIADKKDSAEALYLVGSALVRSDAAAAIKPLMAAVEKDPTFEPAWVALGSAYRYAFQYKNAEGALTTAVKLNPDRTFTRFELCYVQMRLQTVDRNSACDSKAWNVDDWRTFHSSGFNNYNLGNYGEAEKDWRKAAELRPAPAGSLENLGLIYVRQEQWQKAFDNAQIVRLIDAESSWNWLFLSIAADRLGRKEHAREASARWQEFGTKDDVESLTPLLPATLQSYVALKTGGDRSR